MSLILFGETRWFYGVRSVLPFSKLITEKSQVFSTHSYAGLPRYKQIRDRGGTMCVARTTRKIVKRSTFFCPVPSTLDYFFQQESQKGSQPSLANLEEKTVEAKWYRGCWCWEHKTFFNECNSQKKMEISFPALLVSGNEISDKDSTLQALNSPASALRTPLLWKCRLHLILSGSLGSKNIIWISFYNENESSFHNENAMVIIKNLEI